MSARKASSGGGSDADRSHVGAFATQARDPVVGRERHTPEAIAATVNAKDAIENSAFLLAGARGHPEILRLTLAAGADLRSTNRFGGTALIPAATTGMSKPCANCCGPPSTSITWPGWAGPRRWKR